MEDYSLHILWFSATLAFGSVFCVLGLAVRRPLLVADQNAKVREESRVLAYLLAERRGRNGGKRVRVKWPEDKKLVARVLSRALDCGSSETVGTLIVRAEKMGVKRGVKELIASAHAHDRLIAAKLLAYFPRMKRTLQKLAMTDLSVLVRAAALQSLGTLGCQPKPRIWSRWMRLGQRHLHPVVRLLLVNPSLITTQALDVAARDHSAPEDARIWAVGAIMKRDPDHGTSLIRELVDSEATPPTIVGEIMQFVDDPLFVTQLYGRLVASSHWQVREALAQAALRTYAYTLMVQMTSLASDEDWRVRSAALQAMKRLGGFDNVPMPASMRALQMEDPFPVREPPSIAQAS